MKKVIVIIQSMFKNIWHAIKESPKSVGAFITGFNGLFQLAISTEHIQSLVTITPAQTAGVGSQGIGMFFFMFILMGLVAIFAGTRIVDKNSIFRACLTNILAIAAGTYYFLQISNPDTYISFGHVQSSFILMIIGLLLYGLSIVLYLMQIKIYKKEQPVIYED